MAASSMDLDESQNIPFPVATKVAAGIIGGQHTDVAVLGFSNCVVVLVSQLPSVGSVLHAVAASLSNHQGHEGSSTNPLNDTESIVEHLSGNADVPVDIKFLLGNPGASSDVSSLYQICAISITQRKLKRNPNDPRPIVLGIGLKLSREYRLPASEYESGPGSMNNLDSCTKTVDAINELVDCCRIW